MKHILRVRVDIRNCSRCGKHHNKLLLKKFTRRVEIGPPSNRSVYTHWSKCPRTHGEPILVRIDKLNTVEQLEDARVLTEMEESAT